MSLPRFAAVIGTQRSGTTVLRTILATNPEMKTYGEVFIPKDFGQLGGYYGYLHDRIAHNPMLCVPTRENIAGLYSGYLNHLRRMSGDVDLILYDCKYNFLRGACIHGSLRAEEAPLLTLMRHHNFRFIHLVRENVLKLRVSALLSGRTKVWATPNPEAIKDRTVEVPLDTLLPELAQVRDEQHYWAYILGPTALTVYYEDLFVDGEASKPILEAISEHLQVPNEFNTVPKFRKIGLPLKEAIRNYDEVAGLLENTMFERYLED